MRGFLYWALQHKWLLVAFVAGGLLLILPAPAGLSPNGREALVIALVAMILFITEPIPLPTIALLIAVFQVLFSIATPTQVAHTFMNDSVFFILGSLMLDDGHGKHERTQYEENRIVHERFGFLHTGFAHACRGHRQAE